MTDTTGWNHGDAAPAPGWWKASDGNWYPPQQHASAPPPPPPGGYGGYAAPTSNGLATAAMIVGIGSLLLFWAFGLGAIVGLVAVILGIVALSRSKTLAGNAGKGQAIAGIITGALGLVVGTVGLIVAITFLGSAAEEEFRQVGEQINSDPSDGYCDMDRFMQDPDC